MNTKFTEAVVLFGGCSLLFSAGLYIQHKWPLEMLGIGIWIFIGLVTFFGGLALDAAYYYGRESTSESQSED